MGKGYVKIIAMNIAQLSVTQAAEILRVNRSTIVRWCQSGKLKARKVGNQWIIDKAEIDKQQLDEQKGKEK